jgi:hypothetical protein
LDQICYIVLQLIERGAAEGSTKVITSNHGSKSTNE